MSFTRNDFARAVCAALGNTNPSDATLNFLIGWTVGETNANSGATYNLLNTTWDMEVVGQTDFNSVGVKNYPDWNTGIQATIRTLQNGYYPTIVKLLSTNVPKITDNPPVGTIMTELSKWCGGCGYGKGFVTLGGVHALDSFSYGVTPMSTVAFEKEALATWNSFFASQEWTPPPTGTGIYQSWFSDWITQGKQYGPPVTHEYSSHNSMGAPITVQEFTHARCEWNPTTNTPSWYDGRGKI